MVELNDDLCKQLTMHSKKMYVQEPVGANSHYYEMKHPVAWQRADFMSLMVRRLSQCGSSSTNIAAAANALQLYESLLIIRASKVLHKPGCCPDLHQVIGTGQIVFL